jgi:hypothetical protein
MKIEPAKRALLKLLEDPSYWNRTAAVYGLFEMPDNSVLNMLTEKMFSDHMISSDIEEKFKMNIAVHGKFLMNKYSEIQDKSSRDKLIELISQTKIPEGAQFLKNIILDKNSLNRENAFKMLIKNYKGNYSFAKNLLTDKEVNEYALYCILEEGSAEDLSLFKEILKNSDEARLKLIAYQGIYKWAPIETKKEVYLGSLNEKDEALIRGGIYVFKNIFDNKIKERLIILVKKAEYQETRISAAEQLCEYKSAETAPYIIPVFKERYIEEKSNSIIDFFSAMFTLGFSTLFDNLSRKMNRENFEKRINNINTSLQKITGAYLPPSYDKWFNWAIYSGYSVDGYNIIQYLFSSYKVDRLKAIDYSVKLLEYKDKKDFLIKNKITEQINDKELSLIIAKLLIEKGFLKDELILPGN